MSSRRFLDRLLLRSGRRPEPEDIDNPDGDHSAQNRVQVQTSPSHPISQAPGNSLVAPGGPVPQGGVSRGINILDSNQNASIQGTTIGSYNASAGGTQVFHTWLAAPQHPPPPGPLQYSQSAQPNSSTSELSTNDPRTRAQVYYDHLVTERRGSPLWIPSPNCRLPLVYRQKGVSIGDVGILNSDGAFSYLFNVFAPADDPVNVGRVPPSFESLAPPGNNDLEEYNCYGAWSSVTSSTVQRSRDNNSNLQFESSSNEGAILTMPRGAFSAILRNKERINHYLNRQAGSWYDYLLRRGWEVENGDIRLVFGCDKVSCWGIATFLSQHAVTGHVVFRSPASTSLHTPTSLTYDCRGSADAKTGPQDEELAEILDSINLNGSQLLPVSLRNQCVFMRTLNPRLSKEVWDALVEPIKAQSGPGYWSTEDSNTPASQADKGKNPSPKGDQPDTTVYITSNVNTKTSIRHPSSSLNRALLLRFPNARMVITSDDQWMSVISKDEPLPSTTVLLHRMDQCFKFKEEDGIVTASINLPDETRKKEIQDGTLPAKQTPPATALSLPEPNRDPDPALSATDTTSNKLLRKAYEGSRRKLLLAFDVGTTYSGISYSILDPGQSPKIKCVTRFPGQETAAAALRIPTVIYYDQQGNVRAVGAEAAQDEIYEAAREGKWYKAEWFKLHLRSEFGSPKTLHRTVPDLPPNKTVVDVFADFLAYLLTCAASYIQDVYPDGVALWQSLISATSKGGRPSSPAINLSGSAQPQTDGIHFILSHPNGWEGQEQNQMRRAALKANLIHDTPEDNKRITFVTEGESSLHFAIENGVLSQDMSKEGVIVVDAGGGTIDISTYRQIGDHEKRVFEEIAVAGCYFNGSVFVTLSAKDYLKDLLVESTFLKDLDHITACFDQTTKMRFRSDREPQYIKFGRMKDNDADVSIQFGQMKLTGTDVAGFFKSSVDCVVEAVLTQLSTAHHNISHVVLVGGFADSDWLFNQVKAKLVQQELTVTRPEQQSNKAVADGAISFYLDHYVRTRVAKVTYGTRVSIPYNSTDKEHRQRRSKITTDPDGKAMIPGGFKGVVYKNTQVSEETEFKKRLMACVADLTKLKHVETTLMCYRGAKDAPQYLDDDPDNFSKVCVLSADLSNAPWTPQVNPSGEIFYLVTFELVILFGLTELQAQLKWWEDGVEKRSAVTVIHEDPEVHMP